MKEPYWKRVDWGTLGLISFIALLGGLSIPTLLTTYGGPRARAEVDPTFVGPLPTEVVIVGQPDSFITELVAGLGGAFAGGLIAKLIADRSEERQRKHALDNDIKAAYADFIAAMHMMAQCEDRLLSQMSGTDEVRAQYMTVVSAAITALDRAAFVDSDSARVALARKAFAALGYRDILDKGWIILDPGDHEISRTQRVASIRNARDLLLYELKTTVADSKSFAANFEAPRDDRMPEMQDIDSYIKHCRELHALFTHTS